MSKLRLFAALDVPDDRLAALEGAARPWLSSLPGARPVARANQHVTVKFVGWVDAGLLEPIGVALERALAGTGALTLALAGLGAFPSPRRARVVWAGLAGDTARVAELAAAADAALEPLGVAAERRPFRAHVTLARLDPPRRLPEPWPELPSAAGLPFSADRVVLYRSHLGPGGPRYEELRAFALV